MNFAISVIKKLLIPVSLKEETVTIKAESTMESATHPNYSNIVASAILALVAILLMAIVFRKVYCKRMELDKDDLSDGVDVEKGRYTRYSTVSFFVFF